MRASEVQGWGYIDKRQLSLLRCIYTYIYVCEFGILYVLFHQLKKSLPYALHKHRQEPVLRHIPKLPRCCNPDGKRVSGSPDLQVTLAAHSQPNCTKPLLK